MDYIGLCAIALGLSMDAFAVAITNGANSKAITLKKAIVISFSFGLFQCAMPMIGWGIGKAGENLISQIDHWVAFLLLSYIGGKMIYESKSGNNSASCISNNFKSLITLSVATSIDALATGIILPSTIGANSLNLMLLSTFIIGIITFSICITGVYVGKKFGAILSSKAEFIGGLILVLMGIKILLEHLF